MKFKTFWNNFRDVVTRFGIDYSNADWYVKWAEQFAVSIKVYNPPKKRFYTFGERACSTRSRPLQVSGWTILGR